jgi:hypothetical protein
MASASRCSCCPPIWWGRGLRTGDLFGDYGDDPAVRSIVVSYSTNILVNILTALVAFRLLGQLRFGVKESVAGVLALMFCTTHLHYTQNMMENNYIMLLTLAGFSFQYEWLRTDSGARFSSAPARWD